MNNFMTSKGGSNETDITSNLTQVMVGRPINKSFPEHLPDYDHYLRSHCSSTVIQAEVQQLGLP